MFVRRLLVFHEMTCGIRASPGATGHIVALYDPRWRANRDGIVRDFTVRDHAIRADDGVLTYLHRSEDRSMLTNPHTGSDFDFSHLETLVQWRCLNILVAVQIIGYVDRVRKETIGAQVDLPRACDMTVVSHVCPGMQVEVRRFSVVLTGNTVEPTTTKHQDPIPDPHPCRTINAHAWIK
jgi:hypothetical protein